MPSQPLLRPAEKRDAKAMASIYSHYILNTHATFETDPVDDSAFEHRLHDHPGKLPWLVLTDADSVLGYCYAAPWKARSAYARSVEVSIYMHPDAGGRGLGRWAYAQMLEQLGDVHAVMAGIALPNAASIRLHEALGFVKVAHFSEVGYKFGRWIDVGYWQLLRENSD